MHLQDDPQIAFPDMVRTRPGMYVGGTGFYGLHCYLIYAISLLLSESVTHLSLTVLDREIEIVSDTLLRLERTEAGLAPFEVLESYSAKDPCAHAGVVNALSRELIATVTTGQQQEEVHFVKGVQTLYRSLPVSEGALGTRLRFKPDSDIFTVIESRPALFASAFRRLSFLYPCVRFSLSIDGETQVFRTENGLLDLFTAIASPYQLMHEPIHFTCEEGALKLELVMAYHTGDDDRIWGFINSARAVEGGTHEKGLKRGLRRLRKKLRLPERWEQGGAIAVMRLHYHKVEWRGATRRKITNPELKKWVSRLVCEQTLAWLEQHPDIAAQIDLLKTAHLPEDW